KNGTFVNRERVARFALAHADVIQLGSTFFQYLELPRPGESPPLPHVTRVDQLRPPAPGLGTLLPSLAQDFELLAKVAPTLVSVMILGESGAGKEVAARAVHALSGRSGPFVAVNCGGMPGTLVQSELFGYRKGAFSGATED